MIDESNSGIESDRFNVNIHACTCTISLVTSTTYIVAPGDEATNACRAPLCIYSYCVMWSHNDTSLYVFLSDAVLSSHTVGP